MKKNKNKWQENEDKAKLMVEKFINALDKIDCYSNTATLLIEGILQKKLNESGLSKKIDCEDIIDTLEYSFGFKVLKCNSLAEQMKVDAFLDAMEANPYKLNNLQLTF